MIKINLIVVVFLIFVVACTNDIDHKNEVPGINIELKDQISKIPCSDILNLDKIVILETTKNSLIGEITDIIINDSLIYVLDKKITQSIFIFNDKGEFIKKISKRGKGPKEYIRIGSFAFDIYNKKLLVIDPAGRKLLIFSILGKYEKSIRLNDYFEYMHVLNKDHYIFYSNYNSREYKQFSITNKEGKILKRFMKIHKNHFGWGYSYNVFCRINDLTLFAVPYDNTIYSVTGNKPREYLNFTFSGYFIKLNANNMSKEESSVLYTEMAKGKKIITALENLIQVGNILYFSFNYMSETQSVFYNIDKGEIIQYGVLTSDINNLFLSDNKPIGQTKDEFIFLLEPAKELKRYERLKTMPEYAKYTIKYRTIFESPNFDLSGNPVLLFFRIRK